MASAAAVLDETPEALRKKFERAQRRGPDGVTEAEVSGVLARKFGRRWKVRLGPAWG